VLDQQRELLGVAPVRADAAVGAEGDLHAGADRPLERGRAAVERLQRLGAISGGYFRVALRPPAYSPAISVGTRYVPRSFIIFTDSSSRNDPCSIESIPARIATFAPFGAVRVRSRPAPEPVRLLDERVHLRLRQLRRADIVAEREDAAGGADLDDVGAVLHLEADRVTKLIRTAGNTVGDARVPGRKRS
jgi:hypothetical protein